MRPGVQVSDALAGQLLLVQLSVDLRQLRHPEAVAVLAQDLPDPTLNLLRVVGPAPVRAGALVQIQRGWKTSEREERWREGLEEHMEPVDS